jgi:hypothetical protein
MPDRVNEPDLAPHATRDSGLKMSTGQNLLTPGRRLVSILIALTGVIILAAGVVVGHEYLARARLRMHLHAAIPKVRDSLGKERQLLIRAIEAYKGKLGFYPPDHIVSRQPLVVDAVTNQLLYELLGTCHDPTSDSFIPARFPSVHRSLVKSFFGTEGFKNTALNVDEVQHFLDAADIEATMAVHNKPDVALLGYFPDWEGIEPDLYRQIELGSWRYNSSAPMHNPETFDLWIEIRTSETNILIGNW